MIHYWCSLMTSRIIFVFGSNTDGRHGAGAAKFAYEHFGAIRGIASGLQGNAYGIITKDLSHPKGGIKLEYVAQQIRSLHACIKAHRDWLFLITPVGSGLANFSMTDIVPLLLPLLKEPNTLFVEKTIPGELRPQKEGYDYCPYTEQDIL